METPPAKAPPPYSDGRLHARPSPSCTLVRPVPLTAGTHKLVFSDERQSLLHIPAGGADRAAPLMVLLHGACGLHGGGDNIALAYAARHGALLLVPSSQANSWDVIRGGYGPDLAFLDRLLLWTMQRYAVDADAVSIAGFSDGASYALSVGLMNGDLFSDILAFSPGFLAPLRRVGQPRIFIAHGQGDKVLPVQRGQAIAQRLSGEGYAVQYEEFDGAHLVPPAIARAALQRLP